LYFCEKCLTPHSRFWIRLEREDGEVFETVFKCPKCRSRMIQGDLNFSKYACSLCGRKTLSAIGKIETGIRTISQSQSLGREELLSRYASE